MSAKKSSNTICESKTNLATGMQRKGPQKQFYKTKFCMHHLQGACSFGAQCAFAHDLNEIHTAPDLRRTQLCENFPQGRCQDRECNFAHGVSERRATPAFFKKSLCVWNEKGSCRNGIGCRFAHGMGELRTDCTDRPVEMELAAEAFPEQVEHHSDNSHRFLGDGVKLRASKWSKISYQSGSSTSCRPGCSGEDSGNSGNSSGYRSSSDSRGSGSPLSSPVNDPIKVHLFDTMLLARMKALAASTASQEQPSLSTLSSSPLALPTTPAQPQIKEVLEHGLHGLHASQLDALSDDSEHVQQSYLHLAVDVLRRMTALLAKHRLSLEEKEVVGGIGVLGDVENGDSQGLGDPVRDFGKLDDSAQYPQAACVGLNYRVGDILVQMANPSLEPFQERATMEVSQR